MGSTRPTGIPFMDIVFKCPNCQTELEVDASASGETITCPACERDIRIPEPSPDMLRPSAPPTPPPAIKGAMDSAREKRFVVPVTDKPVEPLIQKPLPPLEAQAREPGKRIIRLKTIRHSDCKEVGHDKFDATVTDFLNQVGDENIVSITPINYSYIELGTQKLLTDFGVMIVYRG